MPHTCINHPDRPAAWGCEKCKATVCRSCTQVRAFALGNLDVCPRCGEPLQPIDPADAHRHPSAAGSVFRAFIWPFESDPIMTVVAGAVFFGVAQWVFGFFGWVIWAIGNALILGYGEQVIRHTIAGNEGAPDFQEITSWWDLLPPILRVWAVGLLSFGGFFGLLYSGVGSPWTWLALVFGAAYAPMAFLAVSATGSVRAVLPDVVLRAVARVGPEYWLTVPLLPAAVALGTTLSTAFRFAGGRLFGSVLGFAISLIAVMATCRMLGLLYVRNEDAFEW